MAGDGGVFGFLGFSIWEYRVWVLGFRVEGPAFRGLGFRVWGLGI